MTRIPRLLNRGLALALLVGAVAAIWLLIVLPVMELRRAKLDELADGRQMVSRLYVSSAAREDYEAQVDDLLRTIGESKLYLRGATEPLAIAALQEHVKAIAADHGGGLRSMQSLEPVEENSIKRIRLRVVLNSTHEDFVRMLDALERGKPYLFVDSLDIATSAGGRGALRDADGIRLAVDLVISGYLSPEVSG